MQKKQNNQLFAFKLAKKQEDQKPQQQWQVREDVAHAGCSGEDARAGTRWARDNGIYC